ncbi:MAG: hypothetical protein EPO32_09210 [Anaerolineae bacterium]|nr:MAG: hypothetical protein EPO32_09210 [Anaerolineae bacterium]
MASLLVVSCGVVSAPDTETQSLILTQAAQINQLATSVAAGNEPPTEEPAGDEPPTEDPSSGPPVQMGPDISVYLVNDFNVPICYVYFWPSGTDGESGANLISEEIISLMPGVYLDIFLPTGRYDVRIYDCGGTSNDDLLTQENEVLVASDSGWLYLSAAWISDPSRGLFYVYNNQSVSICAVRVSEVGVPVNPTTEPNLLPRNWEIKLGYFYFLSYPSGDWDIYVYDCNGELADVSSDFLIDSSTLGFYVDGLWGGVAEDPGGSGEPEFTANQDTNCRYGPGSSSFDIRETIRSGESVPIVGVGKAPAQDWWVVVQDGVECWVWIDTGTASGDTTGVPGVTPPTPPPSPTPPTAEQGQNGGNQGDDPGGEQPATCPEPNQVVQVDPSNGAHPTTFTFSISGFEPNDTLYFTILLLPNEQIVYEVELKSNANGNATFHLSTEASDARGRYEVWVMAFDKDMCIQSTDAVFILE